MLAKKDSLGAVNYYKRSLQYDSLNVIALNSIASIYTSNMQFDSALVFLKAAYHNDPGNLLVIQNIALVNLKAGRYEQGIEYANIALKSDTTLLKSYSVLYNCYKALGKRDQAEIAKQKILALTTKQ